MFVINQDVCTQCGECSENCPCGSIELDDAGQFKIDADTCSECANCQEVCPFEAIDEINE